MVSGRATSVLRSGAWALLPALLSGCAVPMSSFHTGRATPKGQVELYGGGGMNLDTSLFGSTWEAGQMAASKAELALEDGSAPLTPREQADLGRLVLAYALVPPTPVWEAGLRAGLSHRLEVGGAWTTSGFGGHAKVQITGPQLDQGAPLDVAIAIQAHRQVFDTGLPSLVEPLFQLRDLARTNLTVPVVASHDLGEYGFLAFGVRALYSSIQAEMLERVTAEVGAPAVVTGGLWGGGAMGAVGVGWRHLYASLELNVTAYTYSPTLMGQEIRFRGVNFYPAAGLHLRPYAPWRRHSRSDPSSP